MRGREEKGRDSPTFPEKKTKQFFLKTRTDFVQRPAALTRLLKKKEDFLKIHTIRKVTLL